MSYPCLDDLFRLSTSTHEPKTTARMHCPRRLHRVILASLCFVLLQTNCSLAFASMSLGDINVVAVTDDHSWVGGHGAHEPLDADYGDLLSFYERLAASTEKAVFLVHNGDFIDGTGLSTYPPLHLEPILLKMPWDAVTVGNHDVYMNETVVHMTRPNGLVDTLEERYLTSNVLNASTAKPIGHRYRYLRGRNVTVLTFGFMYNLHGVGSPLTRVERVEDAVRQEWFVNVLRKGEYDAILVLAHMGTDDPSVKTILSAIRNETSPEMPVQFIAGHTHQRRFDVLDDWSTAVEAGCYLKTIGLLSFPTKHYASSRSHTSNIATTSTLFRHEFIDAKVDVLEGMLGVPNLETTNGLALTHLIRNTQKDMGLTRIVGCAPRTYFMNRSLDEHDSLFRLWSRQVVELEFIANDTKRVILLGTKSSFRYDLFQGNVTVDDLMVVSPFNDSMYLIASDVLTTTLVELNETMNRQSNMDLSRLPDFVLIGDLIAHQSHDLYTLEYEVPFIKRALEDICGRKVQPRPVNAFATSLWLSFLESCWQRCTSQTMCTERPETEPRSALKSNPVESTIRVNKKIGTVSPSSPGIVAVFVAVFSAMSAAILLGRFTLRRLPSRHHSRPGNKFSL